ncbi:hypothetical protein RDWZM_001200 [Blomia tropicalis]|uniref:UBC core domain-containing protein n=1 Tax=Blomia tropicalis TaxID=40697 RepID=A0A9Q0RQI1_BLOTA|nr:ubiquitin-conjugating enzyme E2 K [Blomia tropicalis]KAJ6222655.1 hypothetical protein RDWZM_001200 [Blomia tropicalis]
MTNIAMKRVNREFLELHKGDDDSKKSFHIEPKNNDMLDLKGHIIGPVDTPFEGGTFKLELKIPDTYPFNPPKVRFITRIWHPNISSVTGAICLDILKDQWAAAMTLRTVLLSIQALLSSPEPDDPQDAVVARQFKDHPDTYRQTARYWSLFFATDYSDDKKVQFETYEAHIKKIVEVMHVDKSTALTALSQCNWNIDKAMQNLL